MDKITQRLFGIAAIVFAVAFLIQSASPIQANNPLQATGDEKIGRYQMVMSMPPDDESTYWYVLVWDTTDGRSKFYYGSTDSRTKEAAPQFNLPSSPL